MVESSAKGHSSTIICLPVLLAKNRATAGCIQLRWKLSRLVAKNIGGWFTFRSMLDCKIYYAVFLSARKLKNWYN